jgi:putative flavoprotein involved in K+ transport
MYPTPDHRSFRATITTTVAIVGGGQAGLAMSRTLSRRGIDHVVIERGRVAERWRSERWDSLRLLTPNWMTRLPDFAYDGPDPDGFMTMPEVISMFERYADAIDAPVLEETMVFSAVPTDAGYFLDTSSGGVRCRFLVAATGASATPNIPAIAAAVPGHIHQTSPKYYRRPGALPDGGVLVVGASASGIQLAREIHLSGRQVTVAVGDHTRVPRTYRGVDVHQWFDLMGTLDRTHDTFDDLGSARREPSLQLVGSEDGRNVDLAELQRIGVRIAGRLTAADAGAARFDDSLPATVAAAEHGQTRLLDRIDRWATANGLDDEIEPIDRPDPVRISAPVDRLDLGSVSTVLWATGYRPDFSWLSSPAVDGDGSIRHVGGVADHGLYVLGMPLTRTRKSTFIDGVGADAEAHAAHIVAALAGSRSATPTTVDA